MHGNSIYMPERMIVMMIVIIIFSSLGIGQVNNKKSQRTIHESTSKKKITAATVQNSSGYRIYIDPATGKFTNSPPAGAEALELSPELQNAISTSSDDLKPVALPSGGIMLPLNGRFHDAMVATIDSKGKVHTPCNAGTTHSHKTPKKQSKHQGRNK